MPYLRKTFEAPQRDVTGRTPTKRPMVNFSQPERPATFWRSKANDWAAILGRVGVRISLFGPLTVHAENGLLENQDFGGLKPKELLVALLLARGRPVTKDQLAADLWADGRAPKNVGGTLETYVSQLRKRLFPDRESARRVLVTDSGAYRFALDQVTTDVDVFDELVHRAETTGTDKLHLFTQAAALAERGDLVADLPDHNWIVGERELYRDRATRVHLLAARELLVAGGYGTAIHHAEQALRIRPYAEEAFQQLMVAEYALGHTEASRQTFERCRQLLGDHLGHDPTTATESLAAAIDAGTPVIELIESDGPMSIHTTRGSDDRRDPSRRLPFMARETAAEAVESHVEASLTHGPRVVIVEGVAGIGRSAFLDHLYTRLPGIVGRDRFRPTDRQQPSLPLARALTHALADGSGAIAAAEYEAAPFIVGEGAALEQMRRVLELAAPLTLLLDDLHLADPATVAALGWLRRSAPPLALTVVATVRTPADRASGIDTIGADQVIELQPITPTEAERQYDIDPGIVAVTGGVPRLLADTWRWHRAGGDGVSPSLRASILRATRGLGALRAGLLQATCRIGEPFEAADLDEISSVPAGDRIEALEALCAAGYLRREAGSFRFQAPLVRDVIATTAEIDLTDSASSSRAGR